MQTIGKIGKVNGRIAFIETTLKALKETRCCDVNTSRNSNVEVKLFQKAIQTM